MKCSARRWPSLLRLADGLQKLDGITGREIIGIKGSGAQCIVNGGDAGCRNLCIMGHDGGDCRPGDAGARMIVLFEMIGVQFDKARE